MAKQKRLAVRIAILSVIAIALAYTFYVNFFQDKSVVRVGDEAVNFALTDLEGNRVELAELKGKGVFINFWGEYCPPCKKEMPWMEEAYQEYKDQGIEIVAINVNEAELSVRNFVDRYKLSFPIVIDKGMKVSNAYGINPLPATYLVDEHGKVIKYKVGGMTKKDITDFMELIKPSE